MREPSSPPGGRTSPPTIAVTGLSVAGTLAPGLPVISGLRADPAFASSRIIGFSYDPLDPPSYDALLLDASYLFPYPMHGPARLLERLEYVHERHRLDVIVPTLDSELPNYIELAPRLRDMGIGLVVPPAASFNLRSKMELPRVAEATGLRVPRSQAAYSLGMAVQLAPSFPLPFMVKGNLHGATMVSSLDQLPGAVELQARKWGFPIILQELVRGTEYDVVALADEDSRLIGAVPMKKLQLDDRGKAWGAVTVEDPELLSAAACAVTGLQWRGPLELELMRDDATGEPNLIEMNPRFPAWIHLAVAAGQNLPAALVRIALGERVPPLPGYHAGTMQLRRCVDVTCSLGVYEALVTRGEVDLRSPDPEWIKPRFVSTATATAAGRAPRRGEAGR